MVVNLENVHWQEELDMFNGFVVSEKEVEGLCMIINLLKIPYLL
jgi:hypothetical protein